MNISVNSNPDPSFPDYFRSPRLQQYYFTTYASPAAEFAALQAGSIDAGDFSLNVTQRQNMVSDRRYQVNTSTDLGLWEVVYNAGRFPSNYTSYRRALSYLIDRTDVINNAPGGLGGKLPDQLSPSWPSAWHTPAPEGYDQNFALANATLYADGWRYTGGSTGQWYNLINPSLKIDPTTTIFYARLNDPDRKYIGTQLAATQSVTASTYHFDRLFQVDYLNTTTTFAVTYRAPECGYQSNNCLATGYPAFTAFTQGLISAVPDVQGLFYGFFSTDHLDQSFYNFGHWVNSTINTDVNNLFFTTNTNTRDTLARTVNHLITQQAWWDPIYYKQDWSPSTDRVTGQLSGQNSLIGLPAWAAFNPYSLWRGHLKGRTYGGSLRIGISRAIYDLNLFSNGYNPASYEVFQGIYDSLMYYDSDTGGFLPGLAYSMTVNPLTNPVLFNSKFGAGFGAGWHTTSGSPYWAKNGNGTSYHHVPTGTRVDFTLYSNATWHDGSSVSTNDVIWNIITDAMNFDNYNEFSFATLEDVNVTAANTVTLWFNSTTYENALNSALTLMAPPLPWIYKLGTWVGTLGDVASISLSTKASLNLTAPGGMDMLDGSGPYKFDTATAGDPFALGSTFDVIANNNWYHIASAKSAYETGIVLMSPYLPVTGLSGGGTLTVKVALVNGSDNKGLVWSGGVNDYVPDPTIVSDTPSATVTARIYEGGTPVTLSYNPSSGLYEGVLTLPVGTGIYHLKIDASTGSSATSYGPAGSSQASASGISWEGDPYHTQFAVGTPATYALTFFVNPISGSLTYGGLIYTNGKSDTYTAGSYGISATAPTGYVFAGWNTTGGITVANYAGSSTSATLTSAGTLTANFGLPVTFANNGTGSVQSNAFVSTIDYKPASTNLSFTATGPKGTTGFANVTVPKTLMPNTDSLKVYLNGTLIPFSSLKISMNSTDFAIYFTFVFHSTFTVKMTLCSNACLAPPLPGGIVSGSVLLAGALTVSIFHLARRRHLPRL